ncbi:DUF2333 family protein [Saccharospirillum impatiens]|uniref:DUF2333 family protein n=1 Tax=Saccharospirillum impatiens TaxID=169438 RepID=UPI0004114537|nr:DUF2333 family protein [Saccharospirillum impatiens]
MIRERWSRFTAGVGRVFHRFRLTGRSSRWLGLLVLVVFLALVLLGWYWSNEPGEQDVVALAERHASENNHELVVGYTTTYTLRELMTVLLEKPGGYLSNDVTPPSLWLDNMPSWEFGVIIQVRDLSRAMRRDMSRSQSQSTEDPDLARAEPLFHFDHNSWMLPSTESEYRRGLNFIDAYMQRLSDPENTRAQFYARADNLNRWLEDVETRLGSLSQRLSSSVGQRSVSSNEMLNPQASEQLINNEDKVVKTPRLEVDNVFYEARGSAWALLHILKAVEADFGSILDNKNARVSLQQVIRELEGTQRMVFSPMVLNGSGFGVLANHSLVMANYISRANAALADLRELMASG